MMSDITLHSSESPMATPKLVRSFSTRAVKKVEKPRPLKNPASTLRLNDPQCSSLEDVMNQVQVFSQSLAQRELPPDIGAQSTNLMTKMKLYGPRLEENFEAQLDKAFIHFRNGANCCEITDHTLKLNLLHLIELRAMQWQSTNAVNTYYVYRGSNSNEVFDIGETTVSSPQFSTNLLSPGEVIKSSGKFTSPTKMPGKNYCKDEVVIRNADSGKVMGIKGRRVHMIEELSETVISFQRVSPGAKERLVQITGPEEDKIVLAKQLIEETIKRNASPIRELEKDAGSNSSLTSSVSAEDLPNTGMDSYAFSVCQNNKRVLVITGKDLDILKAAKIILELKLPKTKEGIAQIFEKLARSLPNEEEPDFLNAACSSLIEGSEQIRSPKQSKEASPKEIPVLSKEVSSPVKDVFNPVSNSSLKEEVVPQKEVLNKCSEENNEPVVCQETSHPKASPSIEYTRDFLMDCSSSKASIRLPDDWDKIVSLYPAIAKEKTTYFNASSYLKKWNENLHEKHQMSTASEIENHV